MKIKTNNLADFARNAEMLYSEVLEDSFIRPSESGHAVFQLMSDFHTSSETATPGNLAKIQAVPDNALGHVQTGGFDDRVESYADIPRPSVLKNRPGSKLAAYLMMALNMGLGLMLGPSEASAQQSTSQKNGYIPGVTWCAPNPLPNQPFYYKLFAKREDTQETIVERVYGVLMFNFTRGIEAGRVYEIRAQACALDKDGNEFCSGDSANTPLVVAKIIGNSNSFATSYTINRVDLPDFMMCWNVIRGSDTLPAHQSACDFDGNWKVTYEDLAVYTSKPPVGTWGTVQENPFSPNFVDCSGGRCPETGNCGDVPYGWTGESLAALSTSKSKFDMAKIRTPAMESIYAGEHFKSYESWGKSNGTLAKIWNYKPIYSSGTGNALNTIHKLP